MTETMTRLGTEPLRAAAAACDHADDDERTS